MPDVLSRALTEVIDASAEPVTLEEALGELPRPAARRPRRRRSLLLAAAAIVTAAGLAGALVVNERPNDEQPVATTAPAVETPPLESCIRHMDGTGETCRVSEEQAAVMVGIPINQPDGIPAGWTLVHHDVRVWTAEEFGYAEDIVDFNRAWFRDPAEARRPGVTPDYIQVIVRRSVAADRLDVARSGPATSQLTDGTPVYGDDFTDGLGDDRWLFWLAGDRYYRLRTHGVDGDTALVIADSLA